MALTVPRVPEELWVAGLHLYPAFDPGLCWDIPKKSPPLPVSLYCQKGTYYFLPLQIPCKTLLMCTEGSGFNSCFLALTKPVPLSRSQPDMGVAIP